MINALRYEPRGQRFEPREQRHSEPGQRHIHLHVNLHVHLNLTLRASQKRSTHPNAMRIARICVALVATTVMSLGVFIVAFGIHDGPPDPLLSLGSLFLVMLFAGLALAWGLGCLPLLISAWRASPHGRFRLFFPIGSAPERLFVLPACPRVWRNPTSFDGAACHSPALSPVLYPTSCHGSLAHVGES